MGDVLEFRSIKKKEKPEKNKQLNNIVEKTLEVVESKLGDNILGSTDIQTKYTNILNNLSLKILKEHIRSELSEKNIPDLLLRSIEKENIKLQFDHENTPTLFIQIHLRVVECSFPEINNLDADQLNYYKAIARRLLLGKVSIEHIDNLSMNHCYHDSDRRYFEFQFEGLEDDWSEIRISYDDLKEYGKEIMQDIFDNYGITGAK